MGAEEVGRGSGQDGVIVKHQHYQVCMPLTRIVHGAFMVQTQHGQSEI